jgi:hypothetical protein
MVDDRKFGVTITKTLSAMPPKRVCGYSISIWADVDDLWYIYWCWWT